MIGIDNCQLMLNCVFVLHIINRNKNKICPRTRIDTINPSAITHADNTIQTYYAWSVLNVSLKQNSQTRIPVTENIDSSLINYFI